MKQHFSHVSLFNTKLASNMSCNSKSGSGSTSPLRSWPSSVAGNCDSAWSTCLDDDQRSLALQAGFAMLPGCCSHITHHTCYSSDIYLPADEPEMC